MVDTTSTHPAKAYCIYEESWQMRGAHDDPSWWSLKCPLLAMASICRSLSWASRAEDFEWILFTGLENSNISPTGRSAFPGIITTFAKTSCKRLEQVLWWEQSSHCFSPYDSLMIRSLIPAWLHHQCLQQASSWPRCFLYPRVGYLGPGMSRLGRPSWENKLDHPLLMLMANVPWGGLSGGFTKKFLQRHSAWP